MSELLRSDTDLGGAFPLPPLECRILAITDGDAVVLAIPTRLGCVGVFFLAVDGGFTLFALLMLAAFVFELARAGNAAWTSNVMWFEAAVFFVCGGETCFLEFPDTPSG